MTGVAAIDRAENLADLDAQDGFPPTARPTAIALLVNAASARDDAQHAALSNVLTDEATQKVWTLVEWNALVEGLWRIGTGPLSPILGTALAKVANGFAVPAAELGLTRAAWALAADAKQLTGAVGTGLASLRTHLAHPTPPKSLAEHAAFIRRVQSALGPARLDFVEGAATLRMNNLLGLYEALRGDETYDVGRYEQGVRALIAQFDTNRITQIGDVRQLYGGIELATVRRLRIRGREFVGLFEDFGAQHAASEGGNGTTVHTLTFVRLVEQPMHDVAIAQLKAKRGERALEGRDMADLFNGDDDGVEVIDLDRESPAWARDARKEYRERARKGTLDEVAATPDNPYGLHLTDGDS
jgi:hypothetical protein